MTLKVLTNEKREGLTEVLFNRSRFKLFTLRFSNKSMQAPSCERPKTTQRSLFLVFEYNNCLQTRHQYRAATQCSYITLKRTVSQDFCFWFFHESVSPQPQSIPLGPFRIFSKIRWDIRKSRCTTSINNTSSIFATVIKDTSGKFCQQFC